MFYSYCMCQLNFGGHTNIIDDETQTNSKHNGRLGKLNSIIELSISNSNTPVSNCNSNNIIVKRNNSDNFKEQTSDVYQFGDPLNLDDINGDQYQITASKSQLDSFNKHIVFDIGKYNDHDIYVRFGRRNETPQKQDYGI